MATKKATQANTLIAEIEIYNSSLPPDQNYDFFFLVKRKKEGRRNKSK